MLEPAVGTWVPHQHLSGEHLHSLHDLNLRFLNLLGDAVWSACRVPAAAAKLAALPHSQRAAAANCPYALFDVRFEDETFWASRLASAPPWRIADEQPKDQASVEFVRSALFYAWHVCVVTDRAAQLQLGMSQATAAAFRQAAMDGLSMLAQSEASSLTPRWQGCESYWNALAKAAAGGNAAALRRVQLYGFQLTAAARLPED
jgi:hypothetical protein